MGGLSKVSRPSHGAARPGHDWPGSDQKKAFTLIELLVVVAIIALLISILLPALANAKEQGRKAVCLSNMAQLARASNTYAAESRKELVIGIHQGQVMSQGVGQGWGGRLWWATALYFVYGGRTPQKPFPLRDGYVTVMMDDNGLWGAKTRPLNKFMYGGVGQSDSRSMPVYRCPSDTGFPDARWLYDFYDQMAQAQAGAPCYDIFGNSYRINPAGFYWRGGGGIFGQFSVSSYGHRISSVSHPSRLVLYCEPLFYIFALPNEDWPPDVPSKASLLSWHKSVMTANVAYVDGSARPTRADVFSRFDDELLDAMRFTPVFRGTGFFSPLTLLRRGKDWQTDCYPTPGAFVASKDGSGKEIPPGGDFNQWKAQGGWPFDGYQYLSTEQY